MNKQSSTFVVCAIIFFLIMGFAILKLSLSPDAPTIGSFRREYTENWQNVAVGVCSIAMALCGIFGLLRKNNKKNNTI
jgi:hypothetical protein